MNRRFGLPDLYVQLFIIFFCFFISSGNAEESALYVSPDGNDALAGNTIDKPLNVSVRLKMEK